MNKLAIKTNRRARKYPRREIALRLFWALVFPLFRFSPRLAYGWRNQLLRALGAHIGRDVQIHPRTRIVFPWTLSIGDETSIGEDALIYNLGPITLGQQVTISHGVQLCAGSHDYTRADLPLLRPSITIGDGAWICTEAYIGPGVTVGALSVIGARAVVTRNVDDSVIVAGNPARQIGVRKLKAIPESE